MLKFLKEQYVNRERQITPKLTQTLTFTNVY